MPMPGYEEVNTGLRVNDDLSQNTENVILAGLKSLRSQKFYQAVTDL
jgi:hypothetical protein